MKRFLKVVLINIFLIAAIFWGFHWYSGLTAPATPPTEATVISDQGSGEEHPVSDPVEGKLPDLTWPVSNEEKARSLPESPLQKRDEVLYNYYEAHPLLSYRPMANHSTRVRSFYGKQLIYDVVYKFDDYHRRRTPYSGNAADPDKMFAVFFGGSFVMGDGVNEDETLPFHLSSLDERYVPYNYGFHGYGSQHMLLQLRHADLRTQIPQRRGIFVYHYLLHHRSRLQGSMKELGWTKGQYPFIDYDASGDLQYVGEFQRVRPYYTWLMQWLNESHYLTSRFKDIPDPYWGRTSKKLCDVIVQSKKRALELFPGSEFYVVISYAIRSTDPLADDCLVPNGIKYVNLAKKWDERQRGALFILPGVEDHYNGNGYQYLAKDILESINSDQ